MSGVNEMMSNFGLWAGLASILVSLAALCTSAVAQGKHRPELVSKRPGSGLGIGLYGCGQSEADEAYTKAKELEYLG
jgi:hypothetical protein